MCSAAAVVADLNASGFGSVAARSVSVIVNFSSIVPRSLDLRVSSDVQVFGVRGTVFVDLIWLANDQAAAVLDVVNQAFKGDLQAADQGLIAQASDAVARHISGH
jgi:hypothetical protein